MRKHGRAKEGHKGVTEEVHRKEADETLPGGVWGWGAREEKV